MNPAPAISQSTLSSKESDRVSALAAQGNEDAQRVVALARAADAENAQAQFFLAHSLQTGALGLTRDPERARSLYTRAAEYGYAEAQSELGRMFEEGEGGNQDLKLSRRWYEKAAGQGSDSAKRALRRLEETSTGSPSRKDAGVGVSLPPLTAKQPELVRFDDSIVRLAVRAYVLSLPIFFKENDLISLIAANKAYFVEGGMAILYLQTAGSALAQGAFAFHGESSAKELFGLSSPDMERTAGRVDARMKSQGVALGQDFQWLAQVLPAAAVGDYQPFQSQSQLSPFRQQMLVQVQIWRMSPDVAQPLVAQLQQQLPTIEQEIYDVVCRLDIGLPAEPGHAVSHSEPVGMHAAADGSAERKLGHHENASPGSHFDIGAADQYRDAAQKGDVNAQYNLGVMYAEGKGVEQDSAEAVNWYRKAAERGYAPAQSNLGAFYENGVGIVHDNAEAANWYRRAAEQGYALAQYNLGCLYLQGKGVEQDNAEAGNWFRRAAEQGSAAAQYNLALLYNEGKGVKQDDAAAVCLYRTAAEQGYAPAQNNLGVSFENGRGIMLDNAEAANWFRRAAEQGYALAQFNLSCLYGQGKGVEQDEVTALTLCRKAAEQGYAPAQYTLGLCYDNGRGVVHDSAEAAIWYRKAAEQGYRGPESA